MLSYHEAITVVTGLSRSFGEETIPVEDAYDRILAEDIVSDRNYPPFNRAAMDGFAVLYSDWEKGIRKYRIQETIFAGNDHHHKLQSGACFKIMTGAAVPPPANLIVRREDAVETGAFATLSGSDLKQFQNIAREGEDTKQGEVILKAPSCCTPSVIGLLTTVGKLNVSVKKLPSVAVVTSGDEVVAPEATVGPTQIRNSNQALLKSLLKNWSITPKICEHVPDNFQIISQVLERAMAFDIVIINGGVSAGDADYIPEVLKNLGVEKLFHKVSIRPGKPFWFGRTKNKGVVFALPGNPLSCLTTFTVFIAPFLQKCFGFDGAPHFRLPLLQDRVKSNDLTEFFPVQIDKVNGGLNLLPFNGSGDITAGIGADGLGVHLATNERIAKGEMISFFPFKSGFR